MATSADHHGNLQRPPIAHAMATAWHWQERFEAVDPEDAYRRQALKVQKQISFAAWLQQKKRERAENGSEEDDDRETQDMKQRECNARFLEWVRQKQREKNTRRKEDQHKAKPRGKSPDQSFVKPPSLHVNPPTKRRSQANNRASTAANTQTQHSTTKTKRLTPEQSAAVFAEWERRKKREDRVKRKHEQLNQQLRDHAQRLLHLTRWKKKDVVCAYSTNHRTTQRADKYHNLAI